MDSLQRQQSPPLPLLVLVLLLLVSSRFAMGLEWDGVAITQNDLQGLQAIKAELTDRRGVLRIWNGTGIDACSGAWTGIKCVRGQVIAIQLPWRGLSGRLSSKVGQLVSLRKLNLHDNAIGGPVPPALGLLRELRGVYLFNNRFTGEVPRSIAGCVLLQTLDLSTNSLSGSIPASIVNNTRLLRLNLSYNNISGSIPAAVTRLPALVFVSLQHNNLSGSVPDTWGGSSSNNVSGFQLKSLHLEHNFLSGSIPISLSRLPMLEDLSLSNNELQGSIPEEFGTFPRLKTLDLSKNSISGSFPESLCNLSSLVELKLEGNFLESPILESIDGLTNLSLLDLKKNQFVGPIPPTLGNISGLSLLDLSENNLTGGIPVSIDSLTNLTFFNVSDNNLSGPVPVLLSEKFNSSSFSGNLRLCGYSAAPCPSAPPTYPKSLSTSPEHTRRRLGTKALILIAVAVFLALLILLFSFLFYCMIRNRAAKQSTAREAAARRGEKSGQETGSEVETGGDTGGKLVHFDGPLAFTADDLLCATAEIMGKSTYGTVYKATLEDGSQVAVKRLREKIAKGQKEFEAEVGVLGRIRHPNLLALRAFYLGPKGEKLLVFDFMAKGSLAAFLHDSMVDWPTRMRIAMGITRGLHHLHTELAIVHGNLTSTNVLLDESCNARISDYGFARLMTGAAASSNVGAAAGAVGYRAPELAKLKKANAKTDVYSLGMILLELLTGKPPADSTNGMDLPQWVASIVKEEWINEVFDTELMRDAAATGDELLNTLKLALHCVDPAPAARPEVQQVMQQLEEIKPELAEPSETEGESPKLDE
ncbi:probably inactive leucine-rich repeat receptor-like protein kinase IMK2 isoform X2 [Zingiber officinale]|uniref:probably inactive leucine-rich repeat receptor-like protein kinase IMK2 isoform X2 n=1 Tax=Zingiber officinale TaxID=94328 RepID=UPI001C4B801B|nr:probably inactive leucine-rich repeat receptor-like protein kinase IMK2 isoform X2 [Zingiber officinale]